MSKTNQEKREKNTPTGYSTQKGSLITTRGIGTNNRHQNKTNTGFTIKRLQMWSLSRFALLNQKISIKMLKKKTTNTLLGKRLRDPLTHYDKIGELLCKSLRHPNQLSAFKWLFHKQVDRFKGEQESEPIDNDVVMRDTVHRSLQPASKTWRCFSPTRIKQQGQEEYVYTETDIHVVFNEVYGDDTHERPTRVAFGVAERDQIPESGLFPNSPKNDELDFDLKSTTSYEVENLVDLEDENTEARSNTPKQKRRQKKHYENTPESKTIEFGQQDRPIKLFEKTHVDAKHLLEKQQGSTYSTYCSWMEKIYQLDSAPLEKTQFQMDAEELETIQREIDQCVQRIMEPGAVFNFSKDCILPLQQHLSESDGKTKLVANEIYEKFQLLLKEKQETHKKNKENFFNKQGPTKKGGKRGPGKHNISTIYPDNPKLVPKKGETELEFSERLLGHVENEKLQLELSKEMQLKEFVVQTWLETIEIQIENHLDTGYKYYPPEEDIELEQKYGKIGLREKLEDPKFKKKCQQDCFQEYGSFEGTTNIKALETDLLQHLQTVVKKQIQQQAKRALQREISSSFQDEKYQLSPLLTGKVCEMRVFGRFNVTFELRRYSTPRPSNAFFDVMRTVSWFGDMFNRVKNMIAPHRLVARPCQLCMDRNELDALMSLAQQGIDGFEKATRQAKVHLRKLELLYYNNYDTIEKPLIYYNKKAKPPVERLHFYRETESLLQYEEPLYGGVRSVDELGAAYKKHQKTLKEEKSKAFAGAKDENPQKTMDKQYYKDEDIIRLKADAELRWEATYRMFAR